MSFLSEIHDFFAVDAARATRPDMLVRYIVQIVLLCGSAFFSGSETALFSLSAVDLQRLRRDRNPRAETLHALLDEPRRLIVSILCGNEVVNIAAVTNMTAILVALYGEAKAGAISILVMLPLLLLVGEVTPKTIALSNPRRLSAGLIAAPLSRWVVLVTPLRWVIRAVSDRITTWIVGPQRSPEHLLQIDEVRSLVEDVAEAGRLSAAGRVIINNLLSAGTTEIVKIMTPRSRTMFLDADQDLPDLIEEFERARHFRVPVYRRHRDNLVGFLHVEDVLKLQSEGTGLSERSIDDLLRPPVVVPLTKKVDEMFDFFKNNNARAAAVLNEFGGVAGFITMNDVLHFIFGELAARISEEESAEQLEPNMYEVAGDMKLERFNRITNFGISDPRMTTIAGVAFRHLDRLPEVGDQVTVNGITLTVLKMDAHRIARLRVARVVEETEEEIAADVAEQPEARTEDGAE